MEEKETITLGSIIGTKDIEPFETFDLTEVQEVLSTLSNVEPIDIAHAEYLQQRALYGANIVLDFLGKIIKTTGYLETKINSMRNKVALEYKPAEGKATADMRKAASEASPEVEELSITLARAKGAKAVLEKKYDVLIKLHHHNKDLVAGMRKGVLGYSTNNQEKLTVEGWQ